MKQHFRRSLKASMMWATALTAGVVAATSAVAQQHAAMVVTTSSLSANSNDSRSASELTTIASALQEVGFSVTQVANGVDGAGGLNGVAAAFLNASDGAESRVVYVSGRTLSVDGTVYLLPSAPANPGSMDLAVNALNLDALAGALAAGDTPSLLVINGAFNHRADDALRNSGAAASASDSLSLDDLSATTNIVISTAPNIRNLNRGNRNHAFDNVAAEIFAQGGLSISEVVDALAAETRSSSNRRQAPQVRAVGGSNTMLGVPPLPPISATEQRLWNIAVNNNSIDSYTTYLDLFPNGAFVDDAIAAIESLTPSEQIIPIGETYVVSRNANIRSGPSTQDQRIGTLGGGTLVYVQGQVEGERWFKITLDDNSTAYIFESLVYPYAGSELEAWQNAQRQDSVAAYDTYLASWSDGVYSDAARARRDELFVAEQMARLAPYQIQPASGEVRIVRRANVRDLPDSSGTRMTTLEEGLILTLTGRSAVVNWVEVRLPDGRIGYIWDRLVEDYVEPVAPAPTPVNVLVEDNGSVSLSISDGRYVLNSGGRGIGISLNGVMYGPETDSRTNIVAVEPKRNGARGFDALVISETTGRFVIWRLDQSGRFEGLSAASDDPATEEYFGVDLNNDSIIGEIVEQPLPSIGQRQISAATPLMAGLNRNSGVMQMLAQGTIVDLLAEARRGAWSNVRLSNGVEGWVESDFLAEPTPADELAYRALQGTTDVAAAQQFLANFPNSQYAPRVRTVLDQLAWEQAVAANTVQAMQNYVNNFPNGANVQRARELIQKASNTFSFNLGGIDFNVQLD